MGRTWFVPLKNFSDQIVLRSMDGASCFSGGGDVGTCVRHSNSSRRQEACAVKWSFSSDLFTRRSEKVWRSPYI